MLEALKALPHVINIWFLLATVAIYLMVLTIDIVSISLLMLSVLYLLPYAVCDVVGVPTPLYVNVLLLLLAVVVISRVQIK